MCEKEGISWFISTFKNASIYRSSCLEVFYKKNAHKISQNSEENTCARIFFLITLQAKGCNFIKKRLWHRCFLVNFERFLRTFFFYGTPPVVASAYTKSSKNKLYMRGFNPFFSEKYYLKGKRKLSSTSEKSFRKEFFMQVIEILKIRD